MGLGRGAACRKLRLHLCPSTPASRVWPWRSGMGPRHCAVFPGACPRRSRGQVAVFLLPWDCWPLLHLGSVLIRASPGDLGALS